MNPYNKLSVREGTQAGLFLLIPESPFAPTHARLCVKDAGDRRWPFLAGCHSLMQTTHREPSPRPDPDGPQWGRGPSVCLGTVLKTGVKKNQMQRAG